MRMLALGASGLGAENAGRDAGAPGVPRDDGAAGDDGVPWPFRSSGGFEVKSTWLFMRSSCSDGATIAGSNAIVRLRPVCIYNRKLRRQGIFHDRLSWLWR